MRSKVLQEILDKTPKDVEVFVCLYGDIIVRIHELIKEKGISQKQLAEGMHKSPSEISKWLNGEHNFTLRSLAKLQVELDAPIVYVPKRKEFQQTSRQSYTMTIYRNDISASNTTFVGGKTNNEASKKRFA